MWHVYIRRLVACLLHTSDHAQSGNIFEIGGKGGEGMIVIGSEGRKGKKGRKRGE